SAKEHAPGELVDHARATLPQVKRTARVLGWENPGAWGLVFGCNEHQVSVGVSRWKSRLAKSPTGFEGSDLVRLALERSTSARLAKDVLGDLIERFGQSDGDHVFLLADAKESFVVEAAGSHWAIQECQKTRAVSDAGLIRQDWQRLSRGLAEHVIENGWGQCDGSKMDFHAVSD